MVKVLSLRFFLFVTCIANNQVAFAQAQPAAIKSEFISKNELVEELQARSIIELCGEKKDFHICYFKSRDECFDYVHDAFDVCVKSWDRSKKAESKIPYSRADLYRKSMSDCIERVYSKKPPKNMNIDENRCVNLFLKHATKHSNFEALYLLKVMEAQKKLDSLQEQIDSADHSLCPEYKANDFSGCFAEYLSKWTPTTISEVSVLGIMINNIASRDRTLLKVRNKENDDGVLLGQIRNLYLILDRLDVSKLYISSLVPGSKDLAYKLNQLKADDQKKIDEATWKVIYTIEELLKDYRFDTKYNIKQVNRYNDARNRLESYKMKKWKY